MASLLTQFAPDVWEYNAPLRVIGIEMGHRMTVVRLPGGTLWVHSPTEWSPELDAELRALGEPRHFAIPSRFHDGFLRKWFETFPNSLFSAAPGVANDHPQMPPTSLLGPRFPGVDDGTLLAKSINGMPWVNEVVFLHTPSRTLIVADLMFNLDPPDFSSRLLLRLNGALGKPAPSRMFRLAIRDKNSFRQSLSGVLGWDFDRIIVGHGDNIRENGQAILRGAYSFLW